MNASKLLAAATTTLFLLVAPACGAGLEADDMGCAEGECGETGGDETAGETDGDETGGDEMLEGEYVGGPLQSEYVGGPLQAEYVGSPKPVMGETGQCVCMVEVEGEHPSLSAGVCIDGGCECDDPAGVPLGLATDAAEGDGCGSAELEVSA